MAEDLTFSVNLGLENKEEIMGQLKAVADEMKTIEGSHKVEFLLKKGLSFDEISKEIDNITAPKEVKIEFKTKAGIAKLRDEIKKNNKIELNFDTKYLDGQIDKLRDKLDDAVGGTWDLSKHTKEQRTEIETMANNLSRLLAQVNKANSNYTSGAIRDAKDSLEYLTSTTKGLKLNNTPFYNTKDLSNQKKIIDNLSDSVAKLTSNLNDESSKSYAADILGLTKDFERLYKVLQGSTTALDFSNADEAVASLDRLRKAYVQLENENFQQIFGIKQKDVKELKNIINMMTKITVDGAKEVKANINSFKQSGLLNDLFDPEGAADDIGYFKDYFNEISAYFTQFQNQIAETANKMAGLTQEEISKQDIEVDVNKLNVTDGAIEQLRQDIQDKLGTVEVDIKASDADIDLSSIQSDEWKEANKITLPVEIEKQDNEALNKKIKDTINNQQLEAGELPSQEEKQSQDQSILVKINIDSNSVNDIDSQVEKIKNQLSNIKDISVAITTSINNQSVSDTKKKIKERLNNTQINVKPNASKSDISAVKNQIKEGIGTPTINVIPNITATSIKTQIDKIKQQTTEAVTPFTVDAKLPKNALPIDKVVLKEGIIQSAIDTYHPIPTLYFTAKRKQVQEVLNRFNNLTVQAKVKTDNIQSAVDKTPAYIWLDPIIRQNLIQGQLDKADYHVNVDTQISDSDVKTRISEQINLLTQLKDTINDVTNAVAAKTTAFDSEKDSVNKDIKNEIVNIKNLKSIVDAVVTSLAKINKETGNDAKNEGKQQTKYGEVRDEGTQKNIDSTNQLRNAISLMTEFNNLRKNTDILSNNQLERFNTICSEIVKALRLKVDTTGSQKSIDNFYNAVDRLNNALTKSDTMFEKVFTKAQNNIIKLDTSLANVNGDINIAKDKGQDISKLLAKQADLQEKLNTAEQAYNQMLANNRIDENSIEAKAFTDRRTQHKIDVKQRIDQAYSDFRTAQINALTNDITNYKNSLKDKGKSDNEDFKKLDDFVRELQDADTVIADIKNEYRDFQAELNNKDVNSASKANKKLVDSYKELENIVNSVISLEEKRHTLEFGHYNENKKLWEFYNDEDTNKYTDLYNKVLSYLSPVANKDGAKKDIEAVANASEQALTDFKKVLNKKLSEIELMLADNEKYTDEYRQKLVDNVNDINAAESSLNINFKKKDSGDTEKEKQDNKTKFESSVAWSIESVALANMTTANKNDQSNLKANLKEITGLSKTLTEFMKNNTGMSLQNKQAIESLLNDTNELAKRANVSKAEINNLIAKGRDLMAVVNQSPHNGNGGISGFLKTLQSKNAQFIAQYFSFQDILMYIQRAASEVENINYALTSLKKVSDETGEQLKESFNTAAKSAKELGVNITDMINATTDWNRMGYRGAEAESLAKISELYQNVGDGISQEEASNSLVSIMKGFNLEASKAENIVDKLNEVSNHFAVTSGGLGTALSKSSAALHASNTDLDKSLALVTTIDEVLQNDESTGNILKTLSMRIRSADTELQALGEDTDMYTKSTAKLRDKIRALTGVDIMKDENTFKDIYDILDQIGQKWDKLTDVDRASLAEALAGKRNANALFAILQNTDELEKVYQTSLNSAGSAEREQLNYMESMQAHVKSLQASLQELAYDFIDSGLANNAIDFLKNVVTLLDNITKSLGSLSIPAVLTTIGGIYGSVNKVLDWDVNGLSFMGNYLSKGSVQKQKINNLKTLAETYYSYGEGAKQQLDEDLLKNPQDNTRKQFAEIFAQFDNNIDKVKTAIEEAKKDTDDFRDAALRVNSVTKEIDSGYVKIGDTIKGKVLPAIGSFALNFGLSVVINAVITLVYKLATAADDAAKRIKEITDQSKAFNDSIDGSIDQLIELRKKLDDSNTSTEEAKSIREQMLSIQDQLNEKIKEETGNWSENLDILNSNIEALNNYRKKVREAEWLKEKSEIDNPDNFGDKFDNLVAYGFQKPSEAIIKGYENLENFDNGYLAGYFRLRGASDLKSGAKVLSPYVKNNKLDVDKLLQLNPQELYDVLSDIQTQVQKTTGSIDKDLQNNVIDKLEKYLANNSTFIKHYYQNIIYSNSELDKLYDQISASYDNYQEKLAEGDKENTEIFKKQILSEYNEVKAIVDKEFKDGTITENARKEILSQYKDLIPNINMVDYELDIKLGFTDEQGNKISFNNQGSLDRLVENSILNPIQSKLDSTDLTLGSPQIKSVDKIPENFDYGLTKQGNQYLTLLNQLGDLDKFKQALNGTITLSQQQEEVLAQISQDIKQSGISAEDFVSKFGETGELIGNYQSGMKTVLGTVEKIVSANGSVFNESQLQRYFNSLSKEEYDTLASVLSTQKGQQRVNTLVKAYAKLVGNGKVAWLDLRKVLQGILDDQTKLNDSIKQSITGLLGMTNDFTINIIPVIEDAQKLLDSAFSLDSNGNKIFDISSVSLSDLNTYVQQFNNDEFLSAIGIDDDKVKAKLKDQSRALVEAYTQGSAEGYQDYLEKTLSTIYYNSNFAKNITEANAKEMEAMLRNNGVTNATAVVVNTLNNNLKTNAKAWFTSTDAILAYEEGNKQLITSKLEDMGVTDPEAEAEKQLAIYKELTTAKSEEERQKILEEADASNGLITVIENLRLEELKLSQQDLVSEKQMQQLKDLGNEIKNINGSDTYSSKMSAEAVSNEEIMAMARKIGITYGTKATDLSKSDYQKAYNAVVDAQKKQLSLNEETTKLNLDLNPLNNESSKSSTKNSKQTFDWIQRALDRMSETLDDINKKNDQYGLSTRNRVKILQEENKALQDSVKLNKTAVKAYQERLEQLKYWEDANGSKHKLSDSIIKNIQSNEKAKRITYQPETVSVTNATFTGLKIAQASSNENGGAYGGQYGNQNGKELNFANLQGQPFTKIFRPKDKAIAAQMAEWVKEAVENQHIGYTMDTKGRQTFFQAWKESGSIDKIAKDVATDCSALVSGIASKAGIKINPYAGTSDIDKTLSSSSQIEQMKYDPSKVQAGDIVWVVDKKTGTHHVAIVTGDANGTTSYTTTKITKGSKETSWFQTVSQEEYNAIQAYAETWDKIHELLDDTKQKENEIVKNLAEMRALLLERIQTQFEARENALNNLEQISATIQNNKLTSLKQQTKELGKQEKYYKNLTKAAKDAADQSYKQYQNDIVYADNKGNLKTISKATQKKIQNGQYTVDSIPDNASEGFKIAVLAAINDWSQYQKYSQQTLDYNSKSIDSFLDKASKHLEDVAHNANEKISKWNKILDNYNTAASNPYTSYSTKWGTNNLNISLNKKILAEQKQTYQDQLKEATKKSEITYTNVNNKTKKLTKKQINAALAGTFTVDDMTSSKYSDSMKKVVQRLNTLGETLNAQKKTILETKNAIDEARKQKWEDWSDYFSNRIESLGNAIQKITDKFSNIASSSAYKDTTRMSAYDQVLNSQLENRAFQQLTLQTQQKDLQYIASGINKKYLDEYNRTGSIDTSHINDKTQLKRIQEYLTQQESITETENKIAQSYIDVQQTVVSQLETISTKYNNIISKTQNMLSALEQGATYQESMGHIMSTKFPEMYAQMYQSMANTALQALNEYKAKMQSDIDNGYLVEGTQNYADAQAQLTEQTKNYYNELSLVNQATQQVRTQLEKFAQLGDTQADLFIQSVEAEIAKLDYQLTGNSTSDKAIYQRMADEYGKELGAYDAQIEFYKKQYAYWDNIYKTDPKNTEEALAKRNEYEGKIYQTIEKEYAIRKKIKQIVTDELNAIKSYYDDLLAYEQNRLSLIEKAESREQILGHIVSGEYYGAEIDSNNKQFSLIDEQKQAQIKALQENLDNGIITKNDEEYKKAIRDIDNLELTKVDLQNKNLELMIKQRDVAYEYYDFLLDRMTAITTEADDWINLLTKSTKLTNSLNIDSNNFRDVNIMATKYLTSTGDTALGENYVKYQNALQKQVDLKKELEYTRRELAKDPYDQNMIKKEEGLTHALQEQASAASDAKNAMVDMVKSAYDSAISDLKKQIDAYNDLLDAQKELHDYQESIQSGTQSIAETQKMLLAYQGDTSEAGKARTQKLQKQLKENKKSLQDTQYSKYVSDQKETLNNLYDKIQLLETQVIDDLRYGDGASFEEVTKYIANHSDEIKTTIEAQGHTWGVELSNNQKGIWNKQGEIKTVSEKIRDNVENMKKALDGYADEVIKNIDGFHTELDANLNGNTDKLTTEIEKGYTAVAQIYSWATTDLPKQLADEATLIATDIDNKLHTNPLTAKLDEGTFKTDVEYFSNAVNKFGEIATSWKEANTTSNASNSEADLPSTNDVIKIINGSGTKQNQPKMSNALKSTMNAFDKYIASGYHASDTDVKLGQLGGDMVSKYDKNGVSGNKEFDNLIKYYKDWLNAIKSKGNLNNAELSAVDEITKKIESYKKANQVANNQLNTLERIYTKIDETSKLINKAKSTTDLVTYFKMYNGYMEDAFKLNANSQHSTDRYVRYEKDLAKLEKKGINTSNRFIPTRIINGHAKGVHNLKSDELAWTQENGLEAILRPSDGAILTPLKQNDSVLTADATENLFNFAQSPFDFLKDFSGGVHGNTTAISANNGNTVNNDINMSFTLPNVKNYDELVYAMQHDPKFEKMLRAMTTDRIFGGSSIKKYSI